MCFLSTLTMLCSIELHMLLYAAIHANGWIFENLTKHDPSWFSQ